MAVFERFDRCWLLLMFCLLLHRKAFGNQCTPCSDQRPPRPPCECQDCRDKKMTSVPKFSLSITKCIKILLLDNLEVNEFSNNLKTLEDNVFENYTQLEELYLGKNNIATITEASFNGLMSLRDLDLSYNKIVAPRGKIFQSLTKLEKLDLNDNPMVSVSNELFSGLSNLQVLNLYQTQIRSLEYNAFADLRMLKVLHLHSNKLVSIPKLLFKGLYNLRELELYQNDIVDWDSSTFEDLRMLEKLNMRKQKETLPTGITRIPKDLFRNLFLLTELDLSWNNIEKLEENFFKNLLSLEKLNLNENDISSIESKSFKRLRNLKKLFLESSVLDRVPEVLWVSTLSAVSVKIDFWKVINNKGKMESYDSLPCSCKHINEVKQLRYKVKGLKVVEPLCDEFRPNRTSPCEEDRNFALGMNIAHNCTMDLHYTIMENAIDGNMNTFGTCASFETDDDGDNLPNRYRVDLPGVIVVTNIIVTVKFQGNDGSNLTLNVEAGDRLNNSYTPCNEFLLNHSSPITTVNTSCTKLPSARDIRILTELKDRPLSFLEFWKSLSKPPPAVKFYEIVVNGYERNKYNLWSNWGEWSTCSKSCDNGYRTRNRTCTKPTSLKCEIPRSNRRSDINYDKETCNLGPCFRVVYQWTIGGIAGVFILTVFGIIFWYRKFKMITYFDGLRPNPNFQMDPDRTLLEQIEELPYDLHWEFPRYDVRFASVLGEGNFGRVWHAKAKGIKGFNPRDKSDLSSRAKLAKLQDQRVDDYFTTVTEAWVLGDCDSTHHYDVAVKTLKECATPQHERDLASELKLLIYMDKHPNIVNVLAACTIRGDLWVIMEYCDNGCLKNFLSDRRNTFSPSWSKEAVDISTSFCLYDLLLMSEQIVKGLMFLHCWKVIHRDISARNILVDAKFNLKIADFGLARSDNFVASVDDIMPIKWSALESLLRHEYSTKSDIWSVGILFWELFSLGEMPYPGMSSREVIQQLKEGYRMSAPDNCPTDIWRIISDCWNADPDVRPSAMELFEQLDEVKVSVSSASEGVYYGTGGDDEGLHGTVQGPSLDEILTGKDNLGFEEEEVLIHTAPGTQHTSIEGDQKESGASTISRDQSKELEVKKETLLSNLKHIVAAIPDHDRIDQITRLLQIGIRNENDVSRVVDCTMDDNTATINDVNVDCVEDGSTTTFYKKDSNNNMNNKVEELSVFGLKGRRDNENGADFIIKQTDGHKDTVTGDINKDSSV